MFKKLIASDQKAAGRRRSWGSGSATVSLIFHGLLLAGGVYASVNAPVEEEKVEEEVTFMEIEEEAPEPEPEVQQEAAPPPPPAGFQELVPPDVAPPEIPDVDYSQVAVTAEDFTGLGVSGGVANIEEVPDAPVVEARPDSVFEVAALDYDARPEITNRSEIGRLMSRYYPRIYEEAGIEGQTVVQFVITSAGEVDPSTIKVIQSSHELFVEATQRAIAGFEFRPGRYQGKPVAVMIQIPITWTVQR